MRLKLQSEDSKRIVLLPPEQQKISSIRKMAAEMINIVPSRVGLSFVDSEGDKVVLADDLDGEYLFEEVKKDPEIFVLVEEKKQILFDSKIDTSSENFPECSTDLNEVEFLLALLDFCRKILSEKIAKIENERRQSKETSQEESHLFEKVADLNQLSAKNEKSFGVFREFKPLDGDNPYCPKDTFSNWMKIFLNQNTSDPKTQPSKGIDKGTIMLWTHRGITCDDCYKKDFEGLRFKCLVCNNYDLCEDCIKKGHEHPMIRLVETRENSLYSELTNFFVKKSEILKN